MKSDAEGIQDLRDIRIDARFPDLAGKTAVVTGASRGIGCGIASFLGAQGMRVVITARTEDKGIAFAGQLAAAGVACVWVTADVSTADGAAAVFDAAFRRFGAV
ncbi:SDR family NAD(P)-dependent oxidoreductase, partial [bacterium]|nr:SDR family NAD(P)-dependent oxidoreductase [bacterium]